MATTFEEDFLDFILQRRINAYNVMLREGTEQGRQHAHYTEEYSKIKAKINERLGGDDEAFQLLFDLTDAANLAAGLEMDAAYIQGLQDGFNLVRVLNKGITWPASRDKGL